MKINRRFLAVGAAAFATLVIPEMDAADPALLDGLARLLAGLAAAVLLLRRRSNGA